MDERRAVPRVEPQKPLSARVKTFLPARIVDISSRGAQLELATSLRPEVPCDLRIQLESGDVVVHAIVRRCRAWGFGLDEKDQRVLLYRAGIEFQEPVPEALTKMIAEALGTAAEKAREDQAAKAPAKETGGTKAGVEDRPRAPRSEGPVKIRISSEHVRRVLKRPKDKDKDEDEN
ncbi:MAG TPA: PilZ domain-containing protein [Thermoanaerobaculaceae bacterium]|nr:PilZ domain-containing protein [Thermoanaerobaculaceae bacterium]